MSRIHGTDPLFVIGTIVHGLAAILGMEFYRRNPNG